MNLYSSFYRRLREEASVAFPSLTEASWDHLVSPYSIDLPKSVLTSVQAAVSAAYHLSRRDTYQAKLDAQTHMPPQIRNDSVLMAYDFHTDENGRPHLIEINTNASGYLVSALMNSAHTSQPVLTSDAAGELKQSFAAEMAAKSTPHIAIVDDDLDNQKMYLEFLMYRDLFDHWGWPAKIGEAASLRLRDGSLYLDDFKIGLVYNRCTDFYFTEDAHASLREAWRQGAAVISPQPREYFLLADKQRLIDLGRPGWLESAGATEDEIAALRSVLIPSSDKNDFETVERLWEMRKTLFFKPKRSYGGKSVYRGESVSRKVFDRLMDEDPLIQKFVPAARFPSDGNDKSMNHWTFDVRFDD
jgi:hypothetical protein